MLADKEYLEGITSTADGLHTLRYIAQVNGHYARRGPITTLRSHHLGETSVFKIENRFSA